MTETTIVTTKLGTKLIVRAGGTANTITIPAAICTCKGLCKGRCRGGGAA